MTFTRRFFLLFIGIFLFAAFSSACHKPDSYSLQEKKSLLRLMLKFRVASYDPTFSSDEMSEFVLGLLHRSLFKQNVYGEIKPDLIKKFVPKKNKIFITLKKNILFSNQKKLTSYDVKYSLDRFRFSGRQKWVLKEIKDISIIDEQSFSITIFQKKRETVTDTSVLMAKLSLPRTGIYSGSVHKKEGRFYGAGGYRYLKENSSGLYLQALNKNKPDIHFDIISDEASRYFSFRRNNLDIYEATGVFRFMPYDKTLYKEFSTHSSVVAYGAILPAPNSKLNDPAVRNIINHFFPRDMLCKKTLLKICTAALYPVPASLSPPPSEPKLKTLQTLKKERHIKSFENIGQMEKVKIFTPPERERQSIAVVLAHVLKKLGFEPAIETMDLPSMLRYNNEKTHGIYLLKWMADYPSAENFLMPLFHSANAGSGGNRSWFANKTVDTMLEEMGNDPQKIRAVQEKIQEQSPWVFIGFWGNFYRFNKNLFLGFPSKIEIYGPQFISSFIRNAER